MAYAKLRSTNNIQTMLKDYENFQSSITNSISCYGIGVHSGKLTQLNIKAAEVDSGIIFVRTDIKNVNNIIKAQYFNVAHTTLSTNIKNEAEVEVSTIEHLMAAIWACGIDNLIIEVDGPEIPIMDGSSKPFIWMLECAGRYTQNTTRKYLKILEAVTMENDGGMISVHPAQIMSASLTIDFPSKAIGKQFLSFQSQEEFKRDIAFARTFGFLHELEYLKSKGLAQGASLDNAIGIDQDKILNHDGLRSPKEFVCHKMLDLIGDLYTAGAYIIGNVVGHKTGHTINNLFLRKLFSQPQSYRYYTLNEL